eukprot:2263280-Amphidinium_carterae.1
MALLSKRVEELCRKVRERDSACARSHRFVVNSTTKVCHRVLCLSTEIPPTSWRTVCGWHFSSKSFSLCAFTSPQTPRCFRCFRDSAADDESGTDEG